MKKYTKTYLLEIVIEVEAETDAEASELAFEELCQTDILESVFRIASNVHKFEAYR